MADEEEGGEGEEGEEGDAAPAEEGGDEEAGAADEGEEEGGEDDEAEDDEEREEDDEEEDDEEDAAVAEEGDPEGTVYPGIAASFLLVAGLAGYGAFGSIITGGIPCCFPPMCFATLVTPKTASTIIMLNAIFGTWKFGIPVLQKPMGTVYNYTSYLQDNFVLPILSSAALYNGGYAKEVAYANMAVPFIPLIIKLFNTATGGSGGDDEEEGEDDECAEDDAAFDETKEDYVAGLQCFILGTIAALEEDYYGLGCCLALAGYRFLAKQERLTCLATDREVNMNVFMAIAAYCMKKGFPIKPCPVVVPKKKWCLFKEKKPSCSGTCPQKVSQEANVTRED